MFIGNGMYIFLLIVVVMAILLTLSKMGSANMFFWLLLFLGGALFTPNIVDLKQEGSAVGATIWLMIWALVSILIVWSIWISRKRRNKESSM
jgi:hypothetical protein